MTCCCSTADHVRPNSPQPAVNCSKKAAACWPRSTPCAANRVRRVATGWEGQLSLVVDDVISRRTMFELCEAFFALDPQGQAGSAASGGPGTRLRLRTEVMAGTWEALVSGQAGPGDRRRCRARTGTGSLAVEALGEMPFAFVVAPQHPLARHEGPMVTPTWCATGR